MMMENLFRPSCKLLPVTQCFPCHFWNQTRYLGGKRVLSYFTLLPDSWWALHFPTLREIHLITRQGSGQARGAPRTLHTHPPPHTRVQPLLPTHTTYGQSFFREAWEIAIFLPFAEVIIVTQMTYQGKLLTITMVQESPRGMTTEHRSKKWYIWDIIVIGDTKAKSLTSEGG